MSRSFLAAPRGYPVFAVAVLTASLLFVFSGCSGGSSGGAANVVAPPPPTTTKISGKWEFEKVNAVATGLDYANVQRLPIRNAVVQLITVSDNKIVLTGATDNAGNYTFDFVGTGAVKVRVMAMSNTPTAIQIEDNTNNEAIWAVDAAQLDTNGTALAGQNFVAGLGWGTTSYTGVRASGPFNLLDRCQLATETVLAARPDLKIPALKVNWSPKNNPSATTNIAIGDIGSSNFDGTELYIVGKEDVDTDEFDDHTVIHEWGHFFEAKVSRADSLGGTHSVGDILEPTIAFGEGFGYGIAPIVLTPNTLNVDTAGKSQADGGGYDLENNEVGDPEPGWFSERSVQFIFYDLFDANVEAWDNVNLGLKPILDVLTGAQRTTMSRTSIFSFIDAIKKQNPASALAVDALCAKHKIAPITDEWGSTATNNGGAKGAPWLLPVFRLLPLSAVPVVLTVSGSDNTGSNKASGVRYVRFVGNGAPIRITVGTTTVGDVRIALFEGAEQFAPVEDKIKAPQFGNEIINFPSDAGTTYVLFIQEMAGANAPYNINVTIQ